MSMNEAMFDMNNIIVLSDTFNQNDLFKFNDRSNDSMIDILNLPLKSILYNWNKREERERVLFLSLFLSLSIRMYTIYASSSFFKQACPPFEMNRPIA